MKFFTYSLSIFVLLLLFSITYNLSIKVDNAPDNSKYDVQVDRNLRRYRRDTTNCKEKYNNEEYVKKCNATFNEKLGTYYDVTSIDLTSQFNAVSVCSTDYFYGLKKKNGKKTGDCFLRLKSFSNDTPSFCHIYSCNHISEWKSPIF